MGKTQEELAASREIRQKVLNKYGFIPKSVLEIDYSWGKHIIEYEIRKQQNTGADKHTRMKYNIQTYETQGGETKEFNQTLDAFAMSSQGVRGKSNGVSTFPPALARFIVEYYSEQGDTILDPCIDGDTLIATLDGDIPIKKLVGKEPYVFSSDGEEIKLSKAYNIRKTGANVKVIKILMSNRKFILTTPTHKFLLRNGKYKNANELVPGNSLMPFKRYLHKYKRKNNERYEIQLNDGERIRQSIFVMSQILGKKINTKKYSVHHKDENVRNDNPGNLDVLSISKHCKLHHPIGRVLYHPNSFQKKKLSKLFTGTGNPFFGNRHTRKIKKLIGKSSKNRNIGRKHTQASRKQMCRWRHDKSYIKKIKDLLKLNIYSYDNIARIVGVHINTVGNIARNKYHYNHKVIAIMPYTKKIDVYNMEVDKYHNFAANGVIIHNCAGHNSRCQVSFDLLRNYIGYDVSVEYQAFNETVKQILYGKGEQGILFAPKNTITLHVQSSEKMVEVDNSIDMIYTSPPYFSVEHYTDEPEQLGKSETYEAFLLRLKQIISECHRVLKVGKYCIFNINDFRMNNRFFPFHADVMRLFTEVGFKLHDVVIVKWSNAIGAAFASQVEDRKVTAKSHEYLVVAKKI